MTFTSRASCLRIAALAASAFCMTSAALADEAQSVAARLGGATGIAAFINAKVVPALVASDLKRFFVGEVIPLTESTSQTVTCLSRLLDHDLGGDSAKNGTIATDPNAAPFPTDHQCRSSMTNVHTGMHITDAEFAEFVNIVATQALAAGVAPADVAEVGKVLNRYRGQVTNH
jgi:hypothetical protein